MANRPITDDAVPSADDLRMQLLEAQMQEFEKRKKAKEAEEARAAAAAAEFLGSHITDREIQMIRRLVNNAVQEGKTEAMVYSFPSSLCSDGGRAINNADPDWPDTLQGKARDVYDRFKTIGQPKGYRLKAMILSFPGGFPGDVGFFLSWAPEKY